MLATERLILRKPLMDDLDIISAILSCPIQTQFLPNEGPYSKEQQLNYLVNRISHWDNHGFGTFIISLKNTPDISIGFVGVEYSPNSEYVDIRFGIAKEYESLGYTTEAAIKLIEWTFRHTKLTRIFGVAMHDNLGSKSVLIKLGMKAELDIDLYHCQGLDNFSLESKPSS